jgi:cytochrome c biogenesis protein CcdA
MTGYFPWAAKLTPRPPRFLVRAIAATRKKASDDASHGESSLATPVTFGLLTGLMPCAPLMAAQLTAAASGSALYGGLAMLAFGIGTAPLMLGFGTASSLIPTKLKQRAMALLAIVVIAFGAVYLNRAAMLLGSPVNFETAKQAVLGSPAPAPGEGYTVAEDGVAEVPLTIEDVQFVPSTLNLPADQPVRLIVDRREANACSDQLAIPQLGVLADLAPAWG